MNAPADPTDTGATPPTERPADRRARAPGGSPGRAPEASGGAAAAASGAKGSGDGSGSTASPAVIRRRRIVVALVALVVVLGVVLTIVLLNRPAAEPEALEPVPGETITGPTPTPAVAPVERDKSTALLAALPDAVLQWAVSAQTVDDPAAVAAAAGVTGQPLEAYTLTYSDGSGDATTDVTVAVTQWRTPEAAAAYVAALGLEGTVSREEPVVVAGQQAGTMRILSSETGERVAWNNGATAFVAITPVGAGGTFYDAFGM